MTTLRKYCDFTCSTIFGEMNDSSLTNMEATLFAGIHFGWASPGAQEDLEVRYLHGAQALTRARVNAALMRSPHAGRTPASAADDGRSAGAEDARLLLPGASLVTWTVPSDPRLASILPSRAPPPAPMLFGKSLAHKVHFCCSKQPAARDLSVMSFCTFSRSAFSL